MKHLITAALFFVAIATVAQEINKTDLSLKVTEANQKNNAALKAYIWKKKTEAFINGQSN